MDREDSARDSDPSRVRPEPKNTSRSPPASGQEWTGERNRGQTPAEAKQAVGTSTEKSSEHNSLQLDT
jgi:hypothetical protein